MQNDPNKTANAEQENSLNIADNEVNNSSRYEEELKEIEHGINLIHTDVYALSMLIVAANLVLGFVTIVLLILSFLPFIPSEVSRVLLIVGVVLAVVLLGLYVYIRSKGPSSFSHYCVRSGDGKKKYRYMNYSKRSKFFSDGGNVIESEGVYVRIHDNLPHEEYLHDFFLKLKNVSKHEEDGFVEYSGTLDVRGKAVKGRLRLSGGVMIDGKVGGARLKFFDVNDINAKFYVSPALEEAVKAAKVTWPAVKTVVSGAQGKA